MLNDNLNSDFSPLFITGSVLYMGKIEGNTIIHPTNMQEISQYENQVPAKKLAQAKIRLKKELN